MPNVSNLEWLNLNSLRAYPFKEDASLRPVNVVGDIRIPNSLVVDMILTIPSDEDVSVYLSRLVYAHPTLIFYFSFS